MRFKRASVSSGLIASLGLISLLGCQPEPEQYVAPQNFLTLAPCPAPVPTLTPSPTPTPTPTSTPTPSPSPSRTPRAGEFGGWLGVRLGAGSLSSYSQMDSSAPDCRPLPALLSFEGSITEFGLQSVNSLSTRLISVTNIGLSTATNMEADPLSGPFHFAGGAFPGASGTCGETLAAGASCTLAIQFQPTTIAHEKSSLVIHYHDSAQAKFLVGELTGNGVAYPTLTFQEAFYHYGSVVVSRSREHRFIVRYSGVHPATGISPVHFSGAFQFTGGSYPGTGGTCGTEISSNCTLSVTFLPSATGITHDILKLNYSNGAFAATAEVSLRGLGTAADTAANLSLVAASGSSDRFAGREIGSSTVQTFVVKNAGTLPATSISAVPFTSGAFAFEGGSFPGTSGNCTSTLQSECTLSVVFNPGEVRDYGETLALSYQDGMDSALKHAEIALSGRGQQPALLSVSGGDLTDFGTTAVGAISKVRLILTNTSSEVGISGIASDDLAPPFAISGTTCTSSLGAGQSCSVDLSYAPQSAGVHEQIFRITYTDGFNSRTIHRRLHASATDAAVLAISPESQDFGNRILGTSQTVVFHVRYFGLKPATDIFWANMSGPDFFYDGGTCSTLIYQDCTIAIKFMPSTKNRINAPISLLYFDGYQSQAATVQVSGKGIEPAVLQASPDPLDFASVAVGATKDLILTLTNAGEYQASALSVAGLSAPFTRVGGTCGSSLGASQSCTLKFRFAPKALGTFERSLSIGYSNGLIASVLTTLIKGSGTGTPVIGVTGPGGTTGGQTLSYNFGSVIVGASKSAEFKINYAGLNPAAIISMTELNGSDYFHDLGTCSRTVVTQGCTFTIRFQPTTAVLLQAVFKIVYEDGTGTSKTLQINLQGKGLNPALLSFQANAFVFDATPLRYTRAKLFTLTNATTAQASASLAPIAGIAAPFRIAGGSCMSAQVKPLAPGASCTLLVSFQPQTAQNFDAPLVVSYGNGAATQQLTLGLTGAGVEDALLAANVSGLNFGSLPAGGVKTMTVSLNYYGSRAATIQNVLVGAPFSLEGGFSGGGSCESTISGTCTVALSYKPRALGASNGSFKLTYDDGAGHIKDLQFSLTGTAVSPALLTVTPAAADLGSVLVGDEALVTLVLNLSGSVSATQVSIQPLAPPFSFASNNCGSTLTKSCSVQVRFRPITDGEFQQTLSVSYSNGVTISNAEAQLEARGLRQAILAMNTAGSFNKVAYGNEMQQSFVLSNNGTQAAQQLSLTAFDSGSGFQLLNHDCGTALAAGSSCHLTVRFRPVRPGNASDKFTAHYDNGNSAAVFQWNVTGTGTVPVQIAAKGDHTCALTETAAVKCWGRSDYGQTGAGEVNLGADRWATAVATGYWHSCAILDDGSVKCWGKNDYGQLGLGDLRDRGLNSEDMGDALPVVNLGSGARALALSAGYAHTCALLLDGSVKCWGQNQMGQLGLGDRNDRGGTAEGMGDHLSSVSLGLARKAVQISASVGHTCAVLDDHSLKCWGDNFYGQLGQGDFLVRGVSLEQMGDALPPILLGVNKKVIQVSTGGAFTCAVLDDGALKCWGLNYHGTLGACWALDAEGQAGSCLDSRYRNWTRGYGLAPDQMGDHLPAVELGSALTAAKVSSGAFFSCATLDNGAVKCFGENSAGQLGLGDSESRGDQPDEMGDDLPTLALDGSAPVRDIASGNEHACAVLQDDSIQCWGANTFGQCDY